MRFWVDKENEMFPNKEWDGSYIFTLIRKGYSTIFTNILFLREMQVTPLQLVRQPAVPFYAGYL